MSAEIVIDDGGGPVTGSVDNGSLGAPVTLSNFDNTGVLGWTWEMLYKPIGSAAALSSTVLSTTSFTPDIAGTYLIRLITYVDALKTTADDADEQGYAIRLALPYDWRVPAAGETRQFDAVAGWAPAREEAIRDVHGFMLAPGIALQDAYDNGQQIDTSVVGTPVTIVNGGSEITLDGGLIQGGNDITVNPLPSDGTTAGRDLYLGGSAGDLTPPPPGAIFPQAAGVGGRVIAIGGVGAAGVAAPSDDGGAVILLGGEPGADGGFGVGYAGDVSLSSGGAVVTVSPNVLGSGIAGLGINVGGNQGPLILNTGVNVQSTFAGAEATPGIALDQFSNGLYPTAGGGSGGIGISINALKQIEIREDELNITARATGFGITFEEVSFGDGFHLYETGLFGTGGNVEFVVGTQDETFVGGNARGLQITGGRGGPGDGAVAGGPGADVTITAGQGGAAGGAPGAGPGADLILNAGTGATNGDINIGTTTAAAITSAPAAATTTWTHRGYLNPTRGTILTPRAVAVNDAILLGDRVIRITAAAITLTLPAGAPTGWHLIIKDCTGGLGVAPATLARVGAESIEGVAASYSLAADYGTWYVLFDGTNWWLL